MKTTTREYPFYLKSTVVIFGLILCCYALFTLRDVMAPIAFAMVIAILLNPLVTKLQNKGIKRVLAIAISLVLTVIIITGILYFISSQIMSFGENFGALKVKFNQHLTSSHQWIASHLNIPVDKQKKALSDGLNSSKALLGSALGGVLSTLGLIFLIPIYTFLLLFYKTLIINFFHEVFAEENSLRVSEVLGETKTAIQSYMVGLLLEALVVAIMNSAALLILGVPYAILLGVIGALLNMLPYIGGIIAIALPIIISAVTHDGFTTPLLILASYTLIQFIDNNFLVPFLVSSRVKINALFSIVIVLLGGALWGISGMFLSIPFVAILKIIFDRLPEMKPWGKLLGDEIPTRHKGEIWLRRRKIKESLAEKIVDTSQKK